MRSSGKYKVGEAELLHSAKPLKWFGLNHIPKCTLKLIGLESNQIVQWVSNSLRFETPVAVDLPWLGWRHHWFVLVTFGINLGYLNCVPYVNFVVAF